MRIAGHTTFTVRTSNGEAWWAGFEPLIPTAAAGLRPLPTSQVVAKDWLAPHARSARSREVGARK
jgi:hypothetical protein